MKASMAKHLLSSRYTFEHERNNARDLIVLFRHSDSPAIRRRSRRRTRFATRPTWA